MWSHVPISSKNAGTLTNKHKLAGVFFLVGLKISSSKSELIRIYTCGVFFNSKKMKYDCL